MARCLAIENVSLYSSDSPASVCLHYKNLENALLSLCYYTSNVAMNYKEAVENHLEHLEAHFN